LEANSSLAIAQRRSSHDWRDRHRPDHRRRSPNVSKAKFSVEYDQPQRRRSRRFATRLGSLRQIPLHGGKEPWTRSILASGTPISNTLGEMFTLQRFMQMDALEERGIHEFDAWAATFGETRTELELQPFRTLQTRHPLFRIRECRRPHGNVPLGRRCRPQIRSSKLSPPALDSWRQAPDRDRRSTPAFKAYQRILAERIAKIEERKGKPQKGDDILLSVITDGRHASIDMRFVLPDYEDEPAINLIS